MKADSELEFGLLLIKFYQNMAHTMQGPFHKAKALFACFCCTHITRRHVRGCENIT